MHNQRGIKLFSAIICTLLLCACGTSKRDGRVKSPPPVAKVQPAQKTTSTPYRPQSASAKGNEVVLYAMSLIDTAYKFGGKDTPEAGLDCSGMVSYIYNKSVGFKLTGSAAQMARRGRKIESRNLRPGDLVFFNTSGRPYSHVGIYIGDGRFIHAPSSKGRVRIERMDNSYFAKRFEMARTYF